MIAEGTLNDRVTHQLGGVDMFVIVEDVRQASKAYLIQRARVEHLEHMRKVEVAELIEAQRHAFEEQGQKVTESRLEALALSQPKYKNFLLALRTAKEDLAEKEADYYGKRNMLEVAQGQLSYLKSETYLDR